MNKIQEQIINNKANNILLELPTGYGKTRLSLEICKKHNPNTILIVVNRIVHKENWNCEIHKWWSTCKATIKMVTYASLQKVEGTYDIVIYDECHHLSERCREIVPTIKAKYNILLSATVGTNLKRELTLLFPKLSITTISLRKAITDNRLPDPKIILLPLELDCIHKTDTYVMYPKYGNPIDCTFENRWSYLKMHRTINIKCTERQYYNIMDGKIEWLKNRFYATHNESMKHKWLKMCGDRLVWLSNKKNNIILEILLKLKDKRTLTFCNSIAQTEILGKYCINSKNGSSLAYLQKFNDNKIKHITACNILNESMNLYNCQVGIYANLNNSDIIIKQRTGRILRHKEPIIIIPYYKGTREVKLVDKMLENYNKDLITIINSVDELKI